MIKKLLFVSFLFATLLLSAQKETELELATEKGNLYGSLMLPKTKEKLPLVIIISGSGPTDRNGNNPLMKNNSLLYLAQALAKNKIASFRFDKRGIGKSKAAISSETELRFDTYVNDVAKWIDFIRNTYSDKFSKIIIAGHSEGSLIGMIAAQKAHIDAFISIAGAGKPASKILATQLKQNLKDSMLLSKSLKYIDKLQHGDTIGNPDKALYSLFRPSVQPYMISWFKYNPQNEIEKLTIPILIIQGENDLQVSMDDAKLLKQHCNNCQLVVIPKMNHILKTVETPQQNLDSYNQPDLPINKELITAIVDFIK